MKRAAAALAAIALAAIALAACSAPTEHYTAEYYDVFDTYTVIVSYGSPVPPELHDELLRLHKLFDSFNAYPDLVNVKSINAAGGRELPAPAELLELLSLNVSFDQKSGGTTNVALGSVTALWKSAQETRTLPDESTLRNALTHTDSGGIYIDRSRWTEREILESPIALTDPAASLDFGASAKGYAVNAAGKLADSLGFVGTITVGGCVWTSKRMPEGKSVWTIAIQDPDGGIYQTIELLPGQSAETSGDYERYFELDGVRYHHIINPRTGYPSRQTDASGKALRSVTVVCEDTVSADLLATAMFVEREDALLAEYGAHAYWIYG
ncbi:MAG: FAD:protein FMN transferase [Oscillospiraceae bacterium]|jgi:thiamine biosynthesis lipoprotein|nr:FAD:protein FMN transferase [Oscillospiraceae bacterium]